MLVEMALRWTGRRAVSILSEEGHDSLSGTVKYNNPEIYKAAFDPAGYVRLDDFRNNVLKYTIGRDMILVWQSCCYCEKCYPIIIMRRLSIAF
jgi:hypothetical protein